MTTLKADKEVEKLEPSDLGGNNLKWYIHFGEQFANLIKS